MSGAVAADPNAEQSSVVATLKKVAVVAFVVVLIWLINRTEQSDLLFDKIISTLISVAIAVGASAGLWIGANLLFEQATKNWQRFQALAAASISAVIFFALDGNRLLRVLGPRDDVTEAVQDLTNISTPVTMAVFLGLIGVLVGRAIALYRGSPALVVPSVAVFAVLGLVLGIYRTEEVAGGFFTRILWWPIVAGAIAGTFGWVLGGQSDPKIRRTVGALGGLILGILAGFMLFRAYRPVFNILDLAIPTLLGGALFAAVALVRGRPAMPTVLLGSAIGWAFGAFGFSEVDPLGPLAWQVVAMVVPFVLAGLWASWRPQADVVRRTEVSNDARSWIFLGPALTFIAATLVIPALRTIYLSLFDARSEEWVGFANYGRIFGNELNEDSFDFSRAGALPGSILFQLGVPLLILGGVIGVLVGRRRGNKFETVGVSATPIAIGFVLFAVAIFSTIRGTIINNLWWVFTVTTASTCLGLAIAVLADRSKSEKIAKAFIFLPMAISFVGASIIWRAIYQARDVRKDQTGVLNALWVGLGRLSTGSGLPTLLVTVGLVLTLIAILAFLVSAVAQKSLNGVAPLATIGAALAWFTYRFIGSGVGGVRTGPTGELIGDTVFFVQDSPFNNVWLMIILIWIQTGFAMVILSAAIKAVPSEFLEAARVDGATDAQIFWRITLPQIYPTIGVVVTTIIVVVMKVFDIVKVITNGQFDTQVLANQMFNEAFSFRDKGVGSALAIVLFLSVLPVMFYNIRQMQKAQD